MKEEKDYIRDIAEIRSMMERSSKFLSLSGWAGIMAGVYALAGAFVAWKILDFNPDSIVYERNEFSGFSDILLLSLVILVLALATAIFDSYRKAKSKGEKVWNATSRRLLGNMAVPLITGGIVVLTLIANNLVGLVAPLTLVFYGLALYNAGNFTLTVVKVLGLVQMVLGILACFFVEWGLLIWATGFGIMHILYGIYMFRYER